MNASCVSLAEDEKVNFSKLGCETDSKYFLSRFFFFIILFSDFVICYRRYVEDWKVCQVGKILILQI